MSYKDILGLVLATDADESVIAAAGALADAGEGRATALLFKVEPDPPYFSEAGMISEVWAEMVADAHKAFSEDEAKLRARLERETRAWSMRTVGVMSATLGDRAATEARHADIAVISRPADAMRKAMFEGLLFGSGRPIVIVPPDWKAGAIGRNVVIGWNAKREAARALADARPLLERADKVTILTVDAKPEAFGHGEAPGTDVAAHLARCGLKVEVRNADGLGRSESQALIEESRALEADLLVIGGYGHARMQEMVFGGVTREIVRTAPLPLLLSH